MSDDRPRVWAIYRRVSTEGQAEHGLGLDVQQQQCEAWLKERQLAIGPTFTDVCSGAVLSRDAMGELMIAARSRDYPVRVVGVIIARLDRLARDVMVQEYLIGSLTTTYGLALRLVDPGEDNLLDDPSKDPDPMRKLVRTFMGAIHEFDRKMIARRTAAGRRILQQQGLHAGGNPGNGVVVLPDKRKVLEDRLVPLAQDALRMRQLGATYEDVAVFWDQNGWEAGTPGGWKPINVRRKLGNIKRLGYQPSAMLSAKAALFTRGLR